MPQQKPRTVLLYAVYAPEIVWHPYCMMEGMGGRVGNNTFSKADRKDRLSYHVEKITTRLRKVGTA